MLDFLNITHNYLHNFCVNLQDFLHLLTCKSFAEFYIHKVFVVAEISLSVPKKQTLQICNEIKRIVYRRNYILMILG